jgi:hypothetical protein
VKLCQAVTAKRPKIVIDHLLKKGFITTQELKDTYGYNHPPRAVRDVKEHGIPIEMFRVKESDGRKTAAYRFGDPSKVRSGKQAGRTVLSKELKEALIALHGERCAIYLERFPERELQIDHRIPFEVQGDVPGTEANPNDYMLLCGSANRAKSWSCEHCVNWLELKKAEICRKYYYWAYPDDYSPVAMRGARRADILWTGAEVESYEKLKRRTLQLQKNVPGYVKEIIEEHLKADSGA